MASKCGICQAPERRQHSTAGRKPGAGKPGVRLPLARIPRLPPGFQFPLLPLGSQRLAPGCARPWLLRGRDHRWSRGERDHLWPRGPAQQSGRLGAGPMPAGRLPCSRGAVRVSGPNGPWRHGPDPRPCTSPRVASPSTGAAGLVREPESKGTVTPPHPIPGRPRAARRWPGLGACPTPDTYPRAQATRPKRAKRRPKMSEALWA